MGDIAQSLERAEITRTQRLASPVYLFNVGLPFEGMAPNESGGNMCSQKREIALNSGEETTDESSLGVPDIRRTTPDSVVKGPLK